MTSFIITGAETAGQSLLGGNEVGVVTVTGALVVSGHAVTISGYGALTVSGTISASYSGVSSDDVADIIIGSSGSILATEAGLLFGGGTSSPASYVDNAGTILGSTGVYYAGTSLSLINSGSINGRAVNGVFFLGDTVRITNSGAITGNVYGIISSAVTSETIINTGTISGISAAINLQAGSAYVTNAGLISGAVYLGDGADRFVGTQGQQDNVYGGNGNDLLTGGRGEDILFGQADNDILRGNDGNDLAYGDIGNDTIWGQAGDDTLNGHTGLDQMVGGDGIDFMIGGADADTMYGGRDADTLNGDAGADALRGGDADDLMNGGLDADRVYGEAGDDALFGGIGTFADTIFGGLGNDTMTGGSGNDTFAFQLNEGTDRVLDFVNNVDKLDFRAFDFDIVSTVLALSSDSSIGLRIDLPGEGLLFVAGLTLARLDAADLLI